MCTCLCIRPSFIDFHRYLSLLGTNCYLISMSVVSAVTYRENLFEEMLQEKEEIAVKRKRCKEILRVLQQAAWVLKFLSFHRSCWLS